MDKKRTYCELASRIDALKNCIKSGNLEWHEKHNEAIHSLMDTAPSGSGIDCGTQLDIDRSGKGRLIFICAFHHMNESGMYDGWTEHEIIVTPSFSTGPDIRITGRNRNVIKEYLYDVYYEWLMSEPETCHQDTLDRKETINVLDELRKEMEDELKNFSKFDPNALEGEELVRYKTVRERDGALQDAIDVLHNFWEV